MNIGKINSRSHLPKFDLLSYKFNYTLVKCNKINYNAMITILIELGKSFSQNSYDFLINNLQLHQLTCPSCGRSACLKPHAYYTRHIKINSSTLPIDILRVRCDNCCKTHAVMPSDIVPYQQTLIFDQKKIIDAFETGSDINAICNENSAIDENNVKYIIRIYRRRWREMIRSLHVSLGDLKYVIMLCFSNYSMQFMQNHILRNSLFSNFT